MIFILGTEKYLYTVRSVIIWPVTGHRLILFAPIQLNTVLEVMPNILYVLK